MGKIKTVPHNDVTVMKEPDSSTTEITPHEVLPAILTPEEKANKEIQKFNVAREWIATTKEACKDLKINGQEDKAGYKKVEQAWQEVRNKRLAVQKKHTEIKSDYLTIGRAIDKEKNELVALLEEIETPLSNELDRIENEKKEAELKKERKIQEALQARVSELLENGMGFSGSYYVIGETISMDVVTLKGMKDDEYQTFLGRVKTTNRDILEQKRVDEQKKEDERLALQKQKDDQEAERLRLKDAQDKIDEQNRQLKEKLVKLRTNQVTALGTKFDYNSKSFVYKDEYGGYAFMGLDFMESAEDEAFDDKLTFMTADIETAKKFAKIKLDEAEVKRLADEKKLADKKILDQRTIERERDIFELFGMRLDGPLEYSIKSKLNDEKLSIQRESLIEKDVNGWADIIAGVKKMHKKYLISQERAQAEADRLKEEKRLSKMGDGELIEDVLGKICAPLVMQDAKPKFKTPEGEAVWIKFDSDFNALLTATHAAIDKLK